MKKLFPVLIALIFMANFTFGQRGITWVSAGVKAGYGTSLLFNTSAFQDPAVTYKFFTPAYFYGGKLAFSFNEGGFGFQLEAGQAVGGQNFTIDNGTDVVNHQAGFKLTSFGLIFKAVSLGGFYFELGPQYNLVNSFTHNGNDIKANFVDSYPSGVIGLGFMPLFGDRVELSVGVRGIVSLGSINAVDSYSFFSSSPNFNNYVNNNLMSIMFIPMVDFTYVFAYMGRASCGRFRIMINK